MKKIIIVVAALLSILMISGCNRDVTIANNENKEFQNQNGENTEVNGTLGQEKTLKEEDVFDSEMTHKPTNAEVELIKSGMSMQEVIEIIGKPHRLGPTSGFLTVQWTTEEGNTFVFAIYSDVEGTPEDADLYDIVSKYGIIRVPNR